MAGKEDPVEFDSSLIVCDDVSDVALKEGDPSRMKYHCICSDRAHSVIDDGLCQKRLVLLVLLRLTATVSRPKSTNAKKQRKIRR